MSRAARPAAPSSRASGSKVIVFVIVAAGLVGLLGFAAATEALQGQSNVATGPRAGATGTTPRKPLSREEEAYASALWPIHNDVKLAAMRLASGSIQVKIKGLEADRLRPRVEEAAGVYEQAESQILQLQPPPSLQDAHAQYLRAVRLYRQARDELALMFVDGREHHMDAAAAPREEASQIIRKVGLDLWPNEYMPN